MAMQYYTTRAFPTASRQYEAGDAIDPANITASEWIRGTESGAVVPARWYGTAAELAARGIPGPGVQVYETDTKIARVGDGVTEVASLPQAGSGTYAGRLALTPGATAAYALGPYAPADAVFPTVAVSAGNAATTLAGSPQTIWWTQTPTGGTSAWDVGTTYGSNVGVTYGARPLGTAQFWLSLIAGNVGVTPGTDPTKWQAFTVDPRLRFLGGPAMPYVTVPSGTGSYANGAVYGIQDNASARGFTPVFGYVGSAIELLVPGNNGKYRLIVDGVPDPAGVRAAVGSSGQLHRIKLTFASVDTHTIAIEQEVGQFNGVTIGAADLILPPQVPDAPQVILLGDSVGYGQNIDTSKLDVFGNHLARTMGWDVVNAAQGGTGFVNPGSLVDNGLQPGSRTFVQRITNLAASFPNARAVLACGGLNDTTLANAAYTPSANQAAVTNFITTTRGLLPNAAIFIAGPFFQSDSTNATVWNANKAVRDAQVAAMAANTLPNVYYLDTLGLQTGKYGTGGSANVLISNDTIHPNALGHRYIARWLTGKMQAALPGAGML
jgi:lysophospholipase L1-like esterase